MAKKRKAGSGASRASKAPKEEDFRMRINTFEDVADSEDEFHMNRDKIMLDEGPAAKRMRKYQEEGLSSHAVCIGCED
jgi:U3 small nucleolar RNA-associated protein 3